MMEQRLAPKIDVSVWEKKNPIECTDGLNIIYSLHVASHTYSICFSVLELVQNIVFLPASFTLVYASLFLCFPFLLSLHLQDCPMKLVAKSLSGGVMGTTIGYALCPAITIGGTHQ